jgi:hypothetical protein
MDDVFVRSHLNHLRFLYLSNLSACPWLNSHGKENNGMDYSFFSCGCHGFVKLELQGRRFLLLGKITRLWLGFPPVLKYNNQINVLSIFNWVVLTDNQVFGGPLNLLNLIWFPTCPLSTEVVLMDCKQSLVCCTIKSCTLTSKFQMLGW